MDVTANLALQSIDDQVRAQFPEPTWADIPEMTALAERLAGEAVKNGQLRRVA